MSNTAAMSGYTDAIKSLPEEAFLGCLIFFSISRADVNLAKAKADLNTAGLDTSSLRQILRPVDAFRKATNEFKRKFPEVNEVRSELMVRPVGEDGEQSYRHLVRERTQMQQGKKRRLSYDKVGEITFTRGVKKNGEYTGHSVQATQTADHIKDPLTAEESQWLSERLSTFKDRYDHLLSYMDSHAVRSFVRDYIYGLSGICVKESGGLYFVSQANMQDVSALAKWVRSVGSQFHVVPLLNLGEQKEMILEAFEEETVQEVERLMSEVAAILTNPDRQIEEKTFDAYAERAQELNAKVKEYSTMLGERADQASGSISMFSTQVLSLTSRIRQSKTNQAKVV